MENTEKKDKGKLLTILLAVLIVMLACTAFIPTLLSKNSVEGASARTSGIDDDAMRVLGCCNAYVAANDFSTTMRGTVKARVLGIPYTQRVVGGRKVSGEDYTEFAESTSALIKAALKRERRDGEYYVAHGEYKNKRFHYGKAEELSKDDYAKAYGQPFTGTVKYCIDNAIVKAVKSGENSYRYTLDPARATVHSKNEVRTTLGGKSFPVYKSVEFTLITDGERPIKVTCTEKFRIDKFGGTDCTAEYTEIFKFDE